MRFFNKTIEEPTTGSSLKRISNMETGSLKSWFDNTLMGLGSSFDKYRYHGAPSGDVSEHLHILNELWKELQQREATQ